MTEANVPYISPLDSPKELTARVVIVGIVIGLVMTAANAYLGLYAGMTVSASIPAAVMSMIILRLLFDDVSILENNSVQTMASAGESLAAGVIFTIPALLVAVQTETWRIAGRVRRSSNRLRPAGPPGHNVGGTGVITKSFCQRVLSVSAMHVCSMPGLVCPEPWHVFRDTPSSYVDAQPS